MGKGKPGRWVWHTTAQLLSLCKGAKGFSIGCACGLDNEESSFSMYLCLGCMCVMLFLAYKVGRTVQKCCTPVNEKPVTLNPVHIVCEICNTAGATPMPFPDCRYCGARPSYHHGSCCPVKNRPTQTPERIFLCVGHGKHKYHITKDCRGLRSAQNPVVDFEVCKWCDTSKED